MIRTAALMGGMAGSGLIGWLGVSAVSDRIRLLRVLRSDMLRLTELLANHGMSLTAALEEISGDVFSQEYRAFAEWMKSAAGEEITSEAVLEFTEAQGAFAEMKPQEKDLFVRFFCRLAECISAAEIRLAGEWFSVEAERVIGKLETGELKRAKVFQKVWLLGGMCAAIVLI